MPLSASVPWYSSALSAASVLLPLLLQLLHVSATVTSPVDATAAAACMPALLHLAPCGPFVQGMAPAPTDGDSCCTSFSDVADRRPGCLCMLLDPAGTGFPAGLIPVNLSLAMRLPALCNSTELANTDVGSVCGAGRSGAVAPVAPAVSPLEKAPVSISSPRAIAPPPADRALAAAQPPPPAPFGGVFFGVRSGGTMRAAPGYGLFLLSTATWSIILLSCYYPRF